MIAALDVHYTDTAAQAAAIVFKEWQSDEPIASRTATEEPVAAYIVGVAKNRYRDSEHAVEVFRANSKRPLFVTAIGIEYNVAAQHIQSMAGQFRIPKMLKAADGLARTEIES